MKLYLPRPPRPLVPRRTIPTFHAVPGRSRRDGWTPLRQAEFIGHLAETRSVNMAARRVQMARESAYRLRRRPWAESFCAAWDAAMSTETRRRSHGAETLPRKVTAEELNWRVRSGIWQVRFEAGRYAGVWHKPDNSALLRLLARSGQRGEVPPPTDRAE